MEVIYLTIDVTSVQSMSQNMLFISRTVSSKLKPCYYHLKTILTTTGYTNNCAHVSFIIFKICCNNNLRGTLYSIVKLLDLV